MKYCSRCNLDKNEFDFGKNQTWCRFCNKQYKDQWRRNNSDHIKKYKNQYDSVHTDSLKEYLRKYRKNNKESVAKNRRSYVNERRKLDPVFRLNGIISSVINKSLKKYNTSKNGNSKSKFLPYTIQELKLHLEKQFESWMNWENQGIYDHRIWKDNDSSTWKWNIDHIIPRSDLPYASMEDENFKKCWSLENLRPYSAKQNIIDGANMVRHMGENNEDQRVNCPII